MPNRREPKTKPASLSGHRRRREAADSGGFEGEEWLPEGWTVVEARATRNGQKHQYYLSPSNQHKFYSKSEVSHYLNALQTSCPNTEEKNIVTNNQFTENAVIEKTTAEGLPPGWIKKFKVSKKGGKMRRNPYYTDPATGYIFHSMKDALRYVETGDLGRVASKPKVEGNDDVELDDDNASPAVVGKKERIADVGDHNKELSSKLEVMELSWADWRKSKDPEETEKQTDLPRMESVSAAAVGAVPEKELLDNSSKKRPCRKPKDKRISNLPRRTSKRLSGVEVDPGLQIKPNVRSNRVTESKLTTPTTATLCHEPSRKIDQPKSRLETESITVISTSKQNTPPVNLPSLGLETEGEGFEMKICSSKLPQGGEKSQLSSLNLPFDILNDPCIEFAIKTLTGTAFDASEAIQVLAGSNCSKKLAVEQQFPPHLPQSSREADKGGSPLDLPCKDFWTDPCIEFAVKTLTGAIPLEYDMNVHGSSQQLSSSLTQGNNQLTLSSVDVYQSDFFSTQFT